MSPFCTNCLHWDEESAEDNVEGLGMCLELLNATLVTIDAETTKVTLALVRGDYSCPHFQGKTVTPAPTHPSSETD